MVFDGEFQIPERISPGETHRFRRVVQNQDSILEPASAESAVIAVEIPVEFVSGLRELEPEPQRRVGVAEEAEPQFDFADAVLFEVELETPVAWKFPVERP